MMIVCLVWDAGSLARAQSQEAWTSPYALSQGTTDELGAPASSIGPNVVADESGVVHAFWSAKMDPDLPAIGDTVFYARYDGDGWSQPADILYLGGDLVRGTAQMVDPQGWLHMLWRSGDGVWHSRAPADQAGSAKAWSSPEQVLGDRVGGLSIAVGADGMMHIVYYTPAPESALAYLHSVDGSSWSAPVPVPAPADYEATAASLRLAIDGRGRLHLVVGSPGSGEAAYYLRSEDGGRSWLMPLEIDRRDDRFGGEYGPAWPNVITQGLDEVHLIWDGAPYGQRWHQWSTDGGQSWSAPQQVSPDQRGLTGPNALAFDSLGRLHMVSMGWLDTPGRPSGAFHAYWEDGRWSQMVHIGARTDWDAEGPTLAIASGNVLHAAWWHRTGDPNTSPVEVWASSLETDAPSIPPRPYATPDAEPVTQPTRVPVAEPDATVEERVASLPRAAREGAAPAGRTQMWPVWIAIVPAVLVVGLVILVQYGRHAR